MRRRSHASNLKNLGAPAREKRIIQFYGTMAVFNDILPDYSGLNLFLEVSCGSLEFFLALTLFSVTIRSLSMGTLANILSRRSLNPRSNRKFSYSI